MSGHALFVVAPYLAAVSLVAVTLLRYLLARQHGRLRLERAWTARALFGGPRVWTVGMVGLAVGHVAILGFPGQVLAWNHHFDRLLALEVALFACGVAALLGLLALLVKHVRSPEVRAKSSVADTAFLGLLLVLMVSGLGLAVLYRWASVWSVVALSPYLRSLVQLAPEPAVVEAMPYLVKLHLFTGIALLAVLPFTHLVFALLVPLDRAAVRMAAPFRLAAHLARPRLAAAVRVGGRRLGWQEDED